MDEIIVFRQLEQEKIVRIARRMLNEAAERVSKLGASLEVSNCAVETLATIGFDPMYGARPLRRAIRARVEDRLAEFLLDGSLKKGDTALVDCDNGAITVSVKPQRKDEVTP